MIITFQNYHISLSISHIHLEKDLVKMNLDITFHTLEMIRNKNLIDYEFL
jgi:hypothetical protein